MPTSTLAPFPGSTNLLESRCLLIARQRKTEKAGGYSPVNGRFQSCDALYEAHKELHDAYGWLSDEHRTNGDAVCRIRDFVQKAAATGTVLDTDKDRDLAWALLNYWSNRLYSLTKGEVIYRLAPSTAEPEKV